MPPNSFPKSSLGILPPKSRSKAHQLSVEVWLDERQGTDGAEGLWRVHDGLYDLSSFAKNHPGGKDWIEMTKGIDITEAFESHHISDKPLSMLKHYFIRNARRKRNFPFSFEENGFYRTLKKEVEAKLEEMPKQSWNKSDLYIDCLLVAMFFLSILAAKCCSFAIGLAAGIFLGFVTIAAHNYVHQRDNFRMYYLQFSSLQVREFRISHILSHHLYTNTLHDLDVSSLEPILYFLPVEKGPVRKLFQIFISPVIWSAYAPVAFFKRLGDAYLFNGRNLKMTDLTTLILPLVMCILSGQSITRTLIMWFFIICVSSMHFAFVGLHAGHHHPDVFHDGDKPRSKEKIDWGLIQLDTVMDRKDINGSHFLVLTNFGHHCLHHMFPTLDHGVLQHIYPVFKEVLSKFDLNLMLVHQRDLIFGTFQQLVRTEPNAVITNLKKYASKDE